MITQKELSSGLLTINGESIKWKNGLTRQQCIDLLKQDLTNVTDNINKVVSPVMKNSLSQNKIDALIIFAFNIGNNGFNSSTLLKKLNDGNLNEIPAELMKWTKETKTNKFGLKTKVESKGLVNRRSREVKLWNGD